MTWVKSMGKRLLTGSINLINTPFPVTIFEPRSYLEKLADVWVYPRYLSAAAATTDPAERMKLVVSYFVAGGRLRLRGGVTAAHLVFPGPLPRSLQLQG